MARAEEAKRKNRVERERLFSNLGVFFPPSPPTRRAGSPTNLHFAAQQVQLLSFSHH